ncbi:unnamed protein product [Echinostoma caproni]|uniref:RING-type domain-containing protein n=1 Tax=Echinostoma caproni TaxID=27848 RepID=A0A183ANL1_9TREM|nr:unnamed protein product [Echinostoma caproni]
MLLTKLKAELNCPVCQVTFQQPLLLPCGHSVCTACANKLWFSRETVRWSAKTTPVDSARCTSSGTGSYTEDAVSEADSGVVVGCGGDSNGSLNNAQLLPAPLAQSPGLNSFGREPCPVCASVPRLPIDVINATATTNTIDLAQNWWPRNVALEKLIVRLTESTADTVGNGDRTAEMRSHKLTKGVLCQTNGVHNRIQCQLCSAGPERIPGDAVSFCDQCQLLYCASCQSKWHPPIGTLAGHKLTLAQHVTSQTLTKLCQLTASGVQCSEHVGQTCHLFCTNCTTLLCTLCLTPRNCIDSLPATGHAQTPIGTCPMPYTDTNLARGSPVPHAGHVICSATSQVKRQKVSHPSGVGWGGAEMQ